MPIFPKPRAKRVLATRLSHRRSFPNRPIGAVPEKTQRHADIPKPHAKHTVVVTAQIFLELTNRRCPREKPTSCLKPRAKRVLARRLSHRKSFPNRPTGFLTLSPRKTNVTPRVRKNREDNHR